MRTSLSIAGTSIALLAGAVVVGTLICGGGFGGAVVERMPEIVFAKRPVPIPATLPRLPDMEPTQPVVVVPVPRPVAEPSSPKPFVDPERWTTPSTFEPVPSFDPGPDPMRPVPVAPVPVGPVLVPVPVPVPLPTPMASAGGAAVGLSGDAMSVQLRSASGSYAVPGTVPPGRYEVVVTFPGREAFAATTLVILDGSPKSITCRASLGICKVR